MRVLISLAVGAALCSALAPNVRVNQQEHDALYGAHNKADYMGKVGQGAPAGGRDAHTPQQDRAAAQKVVYEVGHSKYGQHVKSGRGVIYEKSAEANNHRIWAQDLGFLASANCGSGTGVQYTNSEPLCEDHHRFDHGLGNGKRSCKVYRMFADKPAWPGNGFCRTAPQVAPNLEMGAEEQGLRKPYIVRTEMLNWFGHYASALDKSQTWYNGEDIGHVGLYYNAQDSNNYDFVYIQPKNEVHCVQPGYVQGGVVKYYSDTPEKTAMRCSLTAKQMARKWFGLKVEVVDGVAIVTMEDEWKRLEEVAHIQPHFKQTARGGILVANGFTNTAFFRHFYLRHVQHGRHTWDLVTERCSADSRVSFVTNPRLCPSARPHHTCSVLKLHGTTGAWPAAGFCSTLPEKNPPFQGPYMLRANMFASTGDVGLMYNAHSPDDYDFLYITINNGERCVQSGYVEHGIVKWYGAQPGAAKPWLLAQLSCLKPAKPYTWFELTLRLHGTEAEPVMKAYLDGDLIATINPHFRLRASGGALVRNSNGDSAFAKNFELRRDLSAPQHHTKACSRVKCRDFIDEQGRQHVRVTHSNRERMGEMHRCVLTGQGHGTLGNGLAKVGTWKAVEGYGRQCECFCGDALTQDIAELTGKEKLTQEQKDFLRQTREKWLADQAASAKKAV